MSRLPIRLRLTFAFAVVMALVLAATGWFLYMRLGDDLSQSIDQELRSRAEDLSAVVIHHGTLSPPGAARLVEPGERFAELVDAGGRVLEATSPIGTTRLVRSPELARARTRPIFVNRPSVPGLDEPARLLATPLLRDGRRLVLVVGGTRENRAETLRSLRAALVVGGLLALLVSSLAGYLLAGAALRPVEAMRRRASEISMTNLGRRLPVPGARDEVSRLGETLNEMLARLEDAVERERSFVSDASHELRTPLALIKTELELALSRGRSAEELEGAIRSAAAETDRLARIADDLLLIAHADQGRLPVQTEPTDVGDLLRTVAARFGAQAAAEQREIAVGEVDAPVVQVDRLRLEQALGNMVDNALRHGRGGVILTAASRDGTIELHVLDRGEGFAPSFLGRAFERFGRADSARGRPGSGLGLAIAETVARAHGGTAQAANRPGGGADVWLSLPLPPEND